MRRKSHGAVEEGNARAGGRHSSQHTPNSLSQQRKWQRNSKTVQKKNVGTQRGSVLHCFFFPPPPFFGEGARGPVFGGVRKKAAYLFGLFEKKTLKLTTRVIGAVSARVCQIINKNLKIPFRAKWNIPVAFRKILSFSFPIKIIL
jgi:hypothetical protein